MSRIQRPMLDFPAIGLWRPERITIEWTANSRPIIPEIEKVIEQTWQTAMQRPGIHLFDGPMCRLESFHAAPQNLKLVLSRTSYKPFMGTNLGNAHLADAHGEAALANPVGLSTVLISSDNILMLGRRTERVAYYPGRVHPFAGALEPRDDLDVFEDVRRELDEELSLGSSDLIEMVCTGIAVDRSVRQPEMIFATRSSRTAKQIESQLDLDEHRGVWTVPATQPDIEAALKSDEVFTPVAIAAVLLFGRVEFGDDWFARCSLPFNVS